MVKFCTSYFYQIRHFKKNMIPVSTAMFDPQWFHNFMTDRTVFVDKNGIINGLRSNLLQPGKSCTGLCSGIDSCDVKDPSKCKFLDAYRMQLSSIDFPYFYNNLMNMVDNITDGNAKDVIVVFIVHESIDNPCSERIAIQEFFTSHGFPCEELKYPIKDNYEEVS